jgi:phosphoribosyl-ATP pyrophosphohydrolase
MTILQHLSQVIAERKQADPTQSYVAKLHHKGLNAILKKVGEEATEVVLAAKDGVRDEVIYEVADLWFHTLLVLDHCGASPDDVLRELQRREGVSGIVEKAARGDQESV